MSLLTVVNVNKVIIEDKQYEVNIWRRKLMMKEYNVGLDIGVGSVGWAVTDNNGKLLKKGNRNMWGANIFDTAETAVTRRTYRSARRRYLRRRQRINLLRDLFSPLIYPLDPDFFKKLDCSYMTSDDKVENIGEYNRFAYLFGDLMTEKEYYSKYPTIYHLRADLLNNTEQKDPRLIYLAMHHMIKYRGNFLYEGQKINLSDATKLVGLMETVISSLNELFNDELNNFDHYDFIKKLTQNSSRNDIKVQISDEIKKQGFSKETTECIVELTKAVLGLKFKLSKIFLVDVNSDFRFEDENIEEKIEELSSELGENIDVLYNLESLYNILFLKRIIGDKEGTLSQSMIDSYEKHKSDLAKLKSLIKNKYGMAVYNDLMKDKDPKNMNYHNYINKSSKCKKVEFYKKIKAILKDDNTPEAKYILSEIENENFLLKQNSTSNGIFPVQLNLEEMNIILAKQEKYYETLKMNKDKITSILLYRIPYYVGPLNTVNNPHAWVVKKSNEKITPWNFNEVIDKEESAKKFIERMTNHCTYLLGENVLPKNSLLITKYEVLSELNQISIDGYKLTRSEKDQIIEGLFLDKPKVTEKDLRTFILNQQLRNEIVEIRGFQKENEFASSMKVHIDFMNIFGDEFANRQHEIETIIDWLTVYNEKDIIKTRILNEFSFITEEQLKKILAKNYKGYSRLSKKLLTEILGKDLKGNPSTIIEMMENTNLNLMQLVTTKKYGFLDAIEDENGTSESKKVTYEDIANLAGSPGIKRAIWQTILVLDDIKKYYKVDPQNIFIEFAREEGQKNKRTKSRNQALKKIYDEMIKTKTELAGEKITKNDSIYKLIDEWDLSSEKKLLYVMQHGKCAYSGKSLNIDQLENYDVDHILPQAFCKDDSIDNKVLVLQQENRAKSDDLLLNPAIIANMRPIWLQQLKSGLMSKKKYSNLTRTTISDNERIGFINRQLVETRQIIKHVATLLSKNYDSRVYSVKASLGSEFRKKHNLYKLRNLNKVHHAHDAYLSARIGLFIVNMYPQLTIINEIGSYDKIKSEITQRIATQKNKENRDLSSFIINQLNDKERVSSETGELVWKGSADIEYIKKIFNYKDYFISYKVDTGSGKFYDENIQSVHKIAKAKTKFRIKKDRDPAKYGGYTSAKVAFGHVVSYTKNKKTGKAVVSIPIIYSKDLQTIKNYINENFDYDTFEVGPKINIGTEVIIENTKYKLNSMSELRVIEQLFLNERDREVLYLINKNKVKSKHIQEVKELLEHLLDQIDVKVNSLKTNNDKIRDYLQNKNPDVEDVIGVINSVLDGLNQGCTNIKTSDGKLTVSEYSRRKIKNINIDNTIFIYKSPSGIYSVSKRL